MQKDKLCFVRAKQRGGDYYYDAIKNMGYNIVIPYKDINLFFRLLREIWFKLDLPKKEIWYNQKIKAMSYNTFIIKDPLITSEFLIWFQKIHPKARLILDYDNRVSMSINPECVPKEIEKWTYDQDDANRYGMKLRHGAYLDIYCTKTKVEKKYDVLYLGRDKGRLKALLDIEANLKEMGLKTYFHICADRSYMKYKKKIYKPILQYKDYLELLKISKSILNVVQPGQTSLTLREYEAVFNEVKCITTNIGVLDSELYDSSRFFILTNNNIQELPHFFKKPFKPVDNKILKKYTFDFMIEKMILNKKEK